jgi:hypothetical protein
MELISDILLGAGAIGAGVYCLVLARRLRSFSGLEKGMGGAIAVLSRQVDEMTRALDGAQEQASLSAARLDALATRGEAAAQRLELLIAALHDLPDPEEMARQPKLRFVRRRRAAADADDPEPAEPAEDNRHRTNPARLEAAE